MKLLFVTRTPSNRGGHVVLTHLIRTLKKQGVALDFIGFKAAGDPDFPDCEHLFADLDIRLVTVPKHDSDAAQMNEYIDAATTELRAVQDDYDKVILDSWYSAAAGILAQTSPAKAIHFVQSDPYFAPENESTIWKSRFFELLPYFPFKRIMVSAEVRDLFKTRYGVEHSSLDLFIDEAYHTAQFDVADRQPLRLITSSSHFDWASKGLDFLLEQLSELASRRDFSLTLVCGRTTKRDFSRYGFPIAETTARSPEDMVALLQSHDLYLNTSTKETFGLTLAEAVTVGMPAIALDSVGNREYAQGDNFIFVDDQSQFLPKLEALFAVEAREALHKKAKASMSTYSLDAMVEEFKKLAGLPQ